jgi:hypothetical protein
MIDYIFSAGIFVQLALLFYCLGFLARDELWLRGLLLTGTGFYILYYYFINDTPLWEAIATSTVLGLVNMSMIFVLVIERTTFAMSENMSRAYASFSTLTPGQFRKIMRHGHFITTKSEVEICQEGVSLNNLFAIIGGDIILKKGDVVRSIPAPMFVGEIAFLRGRKASATVSLAEGTEYAVLDNKKVRALMEKSTPLSNALTALFSYDLADKVERGMPVETLGLTKKS